MSCALYRTIYKKKKVISNNYYWYFFYLVFNAYICIAKQKFFLLAVVLYNIIRKVKVRLPTSGVDYYIVFAKLASESQFVLVSHDRSLREWETFFCFLLLTSHSSDNNDLFLSSCHIIIPFFIIAVSIVSWQFLISIR